MRTPRIVATNEEFHQGAVIFSKRNSRYLRTVLRRQPGDEIHVLCGGAMYLVELGEWSGGTVRGKIVSKMHIPAAKALPILLAFSCIRPAPTEEILRHGTELGVHEFFPVIAERSNRRPPRVKDRWVHIIESAVSQCGRSSVPTVHDPLPLPDFLQNMPHPATRLVLVSEKNTPCILSALCNQDPERVAILAGPEGGFADRETQLILAAGFRPVSLGRNILRTETAALAAVSIVSAWRDWMTPRDLAQAETSR
uniref:Ribosomal RNA small subunit methyltransferase E n=1 Tax=Desulfomonile tiedjei TaxID=2358 RepID=A0A7C4ATB8_9BACT